MVIYVIKITYLRITPNSSQTRFTECNDLSLLLNISTTSITTSEVFPPHTCCLFKIASKHTIRFKKKNLFCVENHSSVQCTIVND